MVLQWREAMSVGYLAIDQDHQKLLLILNEIIEIISAQNREGEIDKVFAKLVDFASEHFEREEAFQKKIGFSDRYPHRQKHVELVMDLVDHYDKLRRETDPAKKREIVPVFSKFLTYWLLNHVMKEDMKMKPEIIEAKNKGLFTPASAENLFQWQDKMSVGAPALDADHQGFLLIVSDFREIMANKGREAEIDSIFVRLIDFTKSHFTREETLQKIINYPERYEHRQRHVELVMELSDLQDKLKRETDNDTKRAMLPGCWNFIKKWHIEHVLKEDIKMKPFIESIKAKSSVKTPEILTTIQAKEAAPPPAPVAPVSVAPPASTDPDWGQSKTRKEQDTTFKPVLSKKDEKAKDAGPDWGFSKTKPIEEVKYIPIEVKKEPPKPAPLPPKAPEAPKRAWGQVAPVEPPSLHSMRDWQAALGPEEKEVAEKPPEFDPAKTMEEHIMWLVSNGKEGIRAVFDDQIVTRADFKGKNLTQASFKMADISGSDCSGANFSAADMRNGDFSFCNFKEANLALSRLRHAKLKKTQFVEANLRGVDFSGADMAGATFPDADMAQVVLLEADLSDADLSQAKNLTQAQINRARWGNPPSLPPGLWTTPPPEEEEEEEPKPSPEAVENRPE